jgi:hypothetical protein
MRPLYRKVAVRQVFVPNKKSTQNARCFQEAWWICFILILFEEYQELSNNIYVILIVSFS